MYFNRIKDGNISFSREYYTSLLYPSSCNIIICDVNVNVTYMYCDVVLYCTYVFDKCTTTLHILTTINYDRS